MKVSTRGRYALRLMIDLAHHRNEGYVSLKEISARQDITVRYLEQIIAILLKAGFVQSFRGKAGGYRLSRFPARLPTKIRAHGRQDAPRCLSGAGSSKSLRIICAA